MAKSSFFLLMILDQLTIRSDLVRFEQTLCFSKLKVASYLNFPHGPEVASHRFNCKCFHRLHRPHFGKLLQSSTQKVKEWDPSTARIIFADR